MATTIVALPKKTYVPIYYIHIYIHNIGEYSLLKEGELVNEIPSTWAIDIGLIPTIRWYKFMQGLRSHTTTYVSAGATVLQILFGPPTPECEKVPDSVRPQKVKITLLSPLKFQLRAPQV